MQCDTDTVREFLVTAGCPADQALELPVHAPLADMGVSSDVRAALSRILSQALGVPAAPDVLVTTGNLDDWSRFATGHAHDDTVRRAAMARIRAMASDPSPGRDCEVDLMRPEDAPGIARLFYTIYGEHYPVVDYYVPERVTALNRRKDVLTVVGRLANGEIVGQGAYFRSSPPNPGVYEMGQVHVAPEYRQGFLSFRIFAKLYELSRNMDWADAFFGEAVCTHLVTQKLISRHGYAESGLELALMPAGAYEKEGFAHRVSCLMAFRVDRDRPLPLFPPECYRAVLDHILSGFSLNRDVRYAAAVLPEAPDTSLASRVFDTAGVMRVQIEKIGRDFADHAAAIEARAAGQGLAVLQAYCNAADPGLPHAVAVLRERGFVFGAFAPLWFESGDAIMLQRLASPPDFDGINLLTDRARTILAHIRAEWEARGLG